MSERHIAKCDRELGLDRKVTRRDFLNGTLLGAGSLLLDMQAPLNLMAGGNPGWDGYSGGGDYAHADGNTWDVVQAAHAVCDGDYDRPPAEDSNIGENYEIAVVGGGIAGLMAALEFKKNPKPGQKCLTLENHPIFGGEARQNEFLVRGQCLIAPQGSNGFVVPTKPQPKGRREDLVDEAEHEAYAELDIPKQFEHQIWSTYLKPLEFPRDNYSFHLWADRSPSIGYFFTQGAKPKLVRDMWAKNLADTPYPAKIKQDLLRRRGKDRRDRLQ